jgi:hypothetical protein
MVSVSIDAQLETLRGLTKRHEVEMQRQRDLLEAQLQFAVMLQTDLDTLRVILQSDASLPHSERPQARNVRTSP